MNDQFEYGPNGMALTESSEELRLKAYYDPKGVLTIGYGHTGRDVFVGMEITEERADELLHLDVHVSSMAVKKLVTVLLNQNKFDALVDFTFNVGYGHFHSSTLLERVNEGDDEAAASEFLRWDLAGGVVLDGLVTRRKKEAALYLTPA
jgi:lysozyme